MYHNTFLTNPIYAVVLYQSCYSIKACLIPIH